MMNRGLYFPLSGFSPLTYILSSRFDLDRLPFFNFIEFAITNRLLEKKVLELSGGCEKAYGKLLKFQQSTHPFYWTEETLLNLFELVCYHIYLKYPELRNCLGYKNGEIAYLLMNKDWILTSELLLMSLTTSIDTPYFLCEGCDFSCCEDVFLIGYIPVVFDDS